ncbi:endonuclease V [Fodinicola feengrottensis]|uniref:Endonuclease V n=1 Tax=Fodinicola feengrottensis TaxID=435914 RepID=A0ABP4RTS8_9ACTN|nr:endonuclease V [Fodinicola feengrottensis]
MEPVSIAQAEELQQRLASQVEVPRAQIPMPRTVAGLDISYAVGSDRIATTAVLLNLETGAILEESTVHGVATFPYVPGLLAFREVPALLEALGQLRNQPDLLLVDGQGIAHPRRCGSACHLGIRAGLPAIGCAKTRFIGEHREPGPHRGDQAPLLDNGELIGHVLRTQDNVKPMYVSPGHRVGFEQSCDIVLAACSSFRLPDPIRHADRLSRAALALY